MKYKKKRRKRNNKNKSRKISRFRCLDGHLVRSKGELIIDNYFFFLGIKHIYEKVIFLRGNKIKCDWFLPEYNVYVEYWGYSGKRYLKRKNEKLKLYQKEKMRLISIENSMFFDIYTNLNGLLKKYIKKKANSLWNSSKIYCHNCGKELDERFKVSLF